MLAHRTFLRISILLLCVVGFPRDTLAADVSYDLGLYSAYVWRGVSFTDGAVLQPSITTTHNSGFSFNVWGNLDVDDSNDLSGEFQEVDLTLSYGFGEGRLQYEVGLIEYLFPNDVGPSTTETYFSVQLEALVSPTVSVYYDFDQVDGFYASLGLEYSKQVTHNWTLTAAVLAGYVGEDFAAAYGGTQSGLFNSDFTLSVDRTISHGNLTIFASFTDSLNNQVLPEQPIGLWGGFAISFTF